MTALNAHLTVVENTYYQVTNLEAFGIQESYCHKLRGFEEEGDEEEPYQRTYSKLVKPIPLDTGWLEEFSMVYIKNKGEEGTLYVGPDSYVPPQASMRFFPTNKNIVLTPEGKCKITVTVFPK